MSEPKPAWTRCPKCRTRIFNDSIDIEVHRGLCPADFQRAIRRLAARIEELERRPEPVVQEITAEPIIDFEHEAPWPDDEPAETEPEPTTMASIFADAPPAIDQYDDDEEDDEPTPISRPVLH